LKRKTTAACGASGKAKPEETLQEHHAGTYVLEPRVLDLIPRGENHSFEYGLFPSAGAGEPFFAHIPQRTYLEDIGTPRATASAS